MCQVLKIRELAKVSETPRAVVSEEREHSGYGCGDAVWTQSRSEMKTGTCTGTGGSCWVLGAEFWVTEEFSKVSSLQPGHGAVSGDST